MKKDKIVAVLHKVSDILKIVYGYGIMLALFLGGLSFLGYVVAMFIGGETATEICKWIYKTFYPQLVFYSSIFVILGLVVMYLRGDVALTPSKNKSKEFKKKSETVSK